jgi:hypothetical protein
VSIRRRLHPAKAGRLIPDRAILSIAITRSSQL